MSKVEYATEFQYSKVPISDHQNKEDTKEVLHYGFGIRHVQIFLIFVSSMSLLMARSHMGVTVVAMSADKHTTLDKAVNSTALELNNSIDGDDNVKTIDANGTIDYINVVNVSRKVKEDSMLDNESIWIRNESDFKYMKSNDLGIYRTYDWSKPIQEMLLTSFFLGYTLMTFPAAFICQRWGGKIPLQIALSVSSILSILTPWFALWGGWRAVCGSRVLLGMSQCGLFPGIQTLIAAWVPRSEVASMSSYVYTGSSLGVIVIFQIGGILCGSSWKWPSVFWLIGILNFICFGILTVFGASSPMVHKSITQDEINYILETKNFIVQKRTAPWRDILKSVPVWSNIATHVGSGIIMFFFQAEVPSYIHYTSGINVKNSGLLSSLPYMSSVVALLAFGILSDLVINKKIINKRNTRIIANSLSQVGGAAALVASSYTHSVTGMVVCLMVGCSFNTGCHSGWMVNHIDIAPNFSGTLMALGNTLMNLAILMMPILVSNIVIDVTNIDQWRIMIFLVAGIAVVTNFVFTVFMSADVQPWNEGAKGKTKEESAQLEQINEKRT